MMKHRNFLLSMLVLFLTVPAMESYSQETADSLKIWLIDTRDGNSYIGNIVAEDSNQIGLQTDAYGKITISKTQIKKRKDRRIYKQTILIAGSLDLLPQQNSSILIYQFLYRVMCMQITVRLSMRCRF